MQKRLFDIVSLKDRQTGLADIATILTAGAAALTSIFPNIFGGNRRALNESDWLTIMPGSGYWTTKLRNYLASRIKYDVDLKNIQPFSEQFAYDNRDAGLLCKGCDNTTAYSNLISTLQTEQKTAGKSPVGQTPGGYGQTIDWSTVLPIAAIGLGLVLVMKKNKKK